LSAAFATASPAELTSLPSPDTVLQPARASPAASIVASINARIIPIPCEKHRPDAMRRAGLSVAYFAPVLSAVLVTALPAELTSLPAPATVLQPASARPETRSAIVTMRPMFSLP